MGFWGLVWVVILIVKFVTECILLKYTSASEKLNISERLKVSIRII